MALVTAEHRVNGMSALVPYLKGIQSGKGLCTIRRMFTGLTGKEDPRPEAVVVQVLVSGLPQWLGSLIECYWLCLCLKDTRRI